jgi:hypothetical protein
LTYVTLVVEGTTDAAVARRLLLDAGLQPQHEYITNGKSGLDQRLAGYNNAARFSCWLVLRDLDQDAECAPDLRRNLLPQPATHMRLHMPVHAVEAWLLADPETLSRSLSIPQSRFPAAPEMVSHPKRVLVDLARGSRKTAVREALVPAAGTTARVGPGYAAFLTEFATDTWRPAIAAERSDSLARLRTFLFDVAHRAAK